MGATPTTAESSSTVRSLGGGWPARIQRRATAAVCNFRHRDCFLPLEQRRTRLQLGLPLEGTATDELDAVALSGRAKAAYSLGRLSTLLDAFGGNRFRLDINGQEQPVLRTDPNDPALLGLLTAIRCPPADPAEHVA